MTKDGFRLSIILAIFIFFCRPCYASIRKVGKGAQVGKSQLPSRKARDGGQAFLPLVLALEIFGKEQKVVNQNTRETNYDDLLLSKYLPK